jgi:hypothetical protein
MKCDYVFIVIFYLRNIEFYLVFVKRGYSCDSIEIFNKSYYFSQILWLHVIFDYISHLTKMLFLETEVVYFLSFSIYITFDQVGRNVTSATSWLNNQKTHVNSTRPLVKLIKFIVKTKWRISLIAWKAMDNCRACFHCELALLVRKSHLSLRSG